MKSLIVVTWLFIIIGVASWAYFVPGMFYLHDFLHPARIAEMARALLGGHFPVRWSENFNYGFGMPLFEFYAPLPYFVGALFYLVGMPIISVTKLLFVFATVGTALGAYKLGREFYGRGGGLLTAAAVTLAPYRAVNLFVRGALSELWALMAIVWILYYLYKVVRGETRSWMGLTLSLVVLFLSHNILTLLFIPFSLVLGSVFLLYQYQLSPSTKRIVELVRRAGVVTVAYIFSVTLSLFYLLPAYIEKGLTKVQETIIGGYFDYPLHFVYLRQFITPSWGYGGSNWGPVDGISFFLGAAQLIGLLYLLITLSKLLFKRLQGKETVVSTARLVLILGLGIIFIISLLLATEKSMAIWQSLPLLQFAQFPWRFLSISLVLIGLLLPAAFLTQRSYVKRWMAYWVLLLALLINGWYFRPEKQLADPERFYTGEESRIVSDISDTLPDYIPASFDVSKREQLLLISCLTNCDSVVIQQERNTTQRDEFVVATNSPARVRVHTAYYPGWRVSVNGIEVPVDASEGVLDVQVPPGESRLVAEFGSTPIRALADRVSLGATALFLGMVVFYYFRDKGYGRLVKR